MSPPKRCDCAATWTTPGPRNVRVGRFPRPASWRGRRPPHGAPQANHSTVFRLAASGRPRVTASASEIWLPRRDSDAMGRENNAARMVGTRPCTSAARQIQSLVQSRHESPQVGPGRHAWLAGMAQWPPSTHGTPAYRNASASAGSSSTASQRRRGLKCSKSCGSKRTPKRFTCRLAL
jgi:hypothetical protein